MKDSVDKIVTRYFACLTRQDFEFKGVEYKAKPIRVSPLLLRGYTCPSHCGACCLANTLDYLPEDDRPEEASVRFIEIDGRKVKVWTYMNNDHDGPSCKFLNQEDGRCGIYPRRPFSCDFELIRTLGFEDVDHPNVLTQKLYGRGWNMKRIDGERGAKCGMTPPNAESIAEAIRKLERLQRWAAHFGITTWVPEIVKLIKEHRLTESVLLGTPPQKGLFTRLGLPVISKG